MAATKKGKCAPSGKKRNVGEDPITKKGEYTPIEGKEEVPCIKNGVLKKIVFTTNDGENGSTLNDPTHYTLRGLCNGKWLTIQKHKRKLPKFPVTRNEKVEVKVYTGSRKFTAFELTLSNLLEKEIKCKHVFIGRVEKEKK